MGCIQAQLQSHKFFGRPKLALDAVGGESAIRLAEALDEVRTTSGQTATTCLPCHSLATANASSATGSAGP